MSKEKEGKAQVLTQLASQHVVAFTAWLASTALALGLCISCTEGIS